MSAVLSRDALRLESPAAQGELTLLRSLQVGDTRQGVLLPALEVGLTWICTHTSATRWEFDGTFFGQPVYRLVIQVDASMLTLEVR